MDDTNQSRKSDSAATRRRRSSILKAARASRAPLSELEFNVPTPTDTTKGRRVSFSRRNNVAEFVTNEATTTWKNLYEEQNRTLESSVNDSGERPRVQQLGSRLIDQQFQEVILIDFDNGGRHNVESSITASAFGNHDCTVDVNPEPPQQKFELSSLTDHQSKVFGDDLAISGMGELTDKISFNFSTMQPLGESKKDDLEEMEDDFMNRSVQRDNVVCQGPNMGNDSEYIEIDLNTTRIAEKNEESDMSITDTIHSPKVQDVSKSTSSINEKPGQNWVVDKENIALNPYVAPKESETFAVNEEPDKVLVFDGKRLTIQSDRDLNKTNDKKEPEKKPQRKTIVLNVNDDLPNFVDNIDVSRLPNFVENESMLSAKNDMSIKSGLDDSTTKLINQMLDMYEPTTNPKESKPALSLTQALCDISMTEAIPTNIIPSDKSEKRKTILYQNDDADLSVTQAVPSLVLPGSVGVERRKTIVYDSDAGNISMTQALPSHILADINTAQEKRRTIVFDDNKGDVSITQAVPSNLIIQDNAIYKKDSDTSITQFETGETLKASERRQTIIYGEEEGDISMTQAIPMNFLENAAPKRRETIMFEDAMADISATQAVDSNLILAHLAEQQIFEPKQQKSEIQQRSSEPDIYDSATSMVKLHQENRRKTVVFDSDAGDISMTQMVPSNIKQQISQLQQQTSEPERPTSEEYFETHEFSTFSAVKPHENRRKTVVFDSDAGDISMTQMVPSNIKQQISQLQQQTSEPERLTSEEYFETHESSTFSAVKPHENRRKTVVFDSDAGDISMTQMVPSNIKQQISQLQQKKLEPERLTSEEYFETHESSTLSSVNAHEENRRKTIVFDSDAGDISMTQTIPSNIKQLSEPEPQTSEEYFDTKKSLSTVKIHEENKRKTTVFGLNDGDISMTLAIPSNIQQQISQIQQQSSEPEQQTSEEYFDTNKSLSTVKIHEENKRKTIVFGLNDGDISVTQTVPSNIQQQISQLQKQISEPEQQTSEEYFETQESVTSSIVHIDKENKRKAVVVESYVTDIKAQGASDIMTKQIETVVNKRKTIVFDNTDADISVTKPIDSNIISAAVDTYKANKSAIGSNTTITESKDVSVKNIEAIAENKVSDEISRNNDANMSVTKAVPANHVFENIEDNDIEMTQALPAKIMSQVSSNRTTTESETYVRNSISSSDPNLVKKSSSYDADVSMTENCDSNVISQPLSSVDVPNNMFTSAVDAYRSCDKQNVGFDKRTKVTSHLKDNAMSPEARHILNTLVYQTDSLKPISSTVTEDYVFEDKSSVKSESSVKDTLPETDEQYSTDNQLKEEDPTTKNTSLNTSLVNSEQNIELDDKTSAKNSSETDTKQVIDEEIMTEDVETECIQQNPSTATMVSNLTKIHDNVKNSLLNDLLDMSSASLDIPGDGYVDKGITVASNASAATVEKISNHTNSGESFFHIKDTDSDDMQTRCDDDARGKLDVRVPLQITFKESVEEIQEKLESHNKSQSRRHEETNSLIVSKHLDKAKTMLKALQHRTDSANLSRETNNHFETIPISDGVRKDLDEAKIQLKALEDMTEKEKRNQSLKVREDETDCVNPVQPLTFKELQEETVEPLKKEQYSSNYKTEIPEDKVNLPRIQSFISREDLLNNISMAQSMLQKSQRADESTVADETSYTTLEKPPLPKPIQIPRDVVKTLHFEDDESLAETNHNLPAKLEVTALKKMPFDEVSFKKGAKAFVIPDYLENVTDGVKELMDDLVKPAADVPFNIPEKALCRRPSTCSVEVEANLIPSSQIDTESTLSDRRQSRDFNAHKSSIKPTSQFKHQLPSKPIPVDNQPREVIIFDRENPLNNVLLAPRDYSVAHKYNPHSEDNKHQSLTYENSSTNIRGKDSAQFNVETAVDKYNSPCRNTVDANEDHYKEETTDFYNRPNMNIHKESPSSKMRCAQVNTVIAMKENKQILQESSSLALIDNIVNKDDLIVEVHGDADKDSNCNASSNDKIRSPIQVLYLSSISDRSAIKPTAIQSNDYTHELKTKKRPYSVPKRDKNTPSPRTTPKQNIKIRKLSKTPTGSTRSSPESVQADKLRDNSRKSPKKTKHSPKKAAIDKSPDKQTQNRVTEVIDIFTSNPVTSHSDVDSALLTTLKGSSSKTESLTSTPVTSTQRGPNNIPKSHCDQMDWQAGSLCGLSSKNLMAAYRSNINVLEKIDALPFMGSRECTWETNTEDLSWLLLNGRVRLTVHLQDQSVERIKSGVSPSMPVKATAVQLLKEEPDAITSLCVQFAAHAIRHETARVSDAGAVPALLRRSVATARVAVRWARAMKDSKLRLAYKLDREGSFTLKVANIPLRSVWMLKMHLKMSSEAGEAPWPRASDACVLTVHGTSVPSEAVEKAVRAAPKDWGHALHAMWGVFKYLKHRKPEDV